MLTQRVLLLDARICGPNGSSERSSQCHSVHLHYTRAVGSRSCLSAGHLWLLHSNTAASCCSQHPIARMKGNLLDLLTLILLIHHRVVPVFQGGGVQACLQPLVMQEGYGSPDTSISLKAMAFHLYCQHFGEGTAVF